MKRNNFWRWVLVIFVVAWALRELYPPTDRDLIQVFQQKAENKDTNFTAIVSRAVTLQKQHPERAYGNLLEAIHTNDITRYFPSIKVAPEEENPTRYVLNRVQRAAAGQIKLGLDLRGGTSFLLEMDTKKVGTATEPQHALAQAVEVLRKRVDKLGVAEPIIQPAGENRIVVALPGLSEAENANAREQIQAAAFLEFRMVHPENEELLKQGLPAPNYTLMKIKPKRGQEGRIEQYWVKNKPERDLTGKYIKHASVARHAVSNEPEIHFTLDDEGATKFREITTEYSPQGNKYFQLAIVLDGELKSAPRILGPIPTGSGMISGSFTLEEAIELANVLENPLEAPLNLIEERRVDPSLGKDSIRSGITASIVGTVAVALFMLVYYLYAGIVANVALLLNIVLLLGVLCSVDSTLTIPGIAGIVLSIGMAVDANVLIYERMREELAAGKSLRGAISAGYDKAFGAIFDSNITTLISSIILIYMGTGPVKGFGVTLTIGIALNMLTALVVTRLLFDWFLDKGWLKSLPMLQFVKEPNLDYMRYAKMAGIASAVFICVGLGYGIYRGHDLLGVDFAGGDNLTLRFAQKMDVDKLRQAIEGPETGIRESFIQYQKDLGSGTENLRVTVPVDEGVKAETALKKAFPQAKFERIALDKVGPTVGLEIQKAAITAILLAIFGILIYVAMRYEFSFAVAGIVALLHDVFITMGAFCLAGGQFSAPMVAAVLTIIGFSINDTIVIFDRIREDLKLGIRGTYKEVTNKALNQTLSRTIFTSLTVLMATLALYIFGGGVIHDFAFCFLVGILAGTYSSLFISPGFVLFWHKGQRPSIGASQVAMEQQPSAARV